MKEYVLIVIIVLGLIFVFSSAISNSIEKTLDKMEIEKCLKLQQQAIDYPLFWATEHEKTMCEHHNIEIKKPCASCRVE